jgi:hypothetical protein
MPSGGKHTTKAEVTGSTAGTTIVGATLADRLDRLRGADSVKGRQGPTGLTVGRASTARGGAGDDTALTGLCDGFDRIEDGQGAGALVPGAGITLDMLRVVPGLGSIVPEVVWTCLRIDTGHPPNPAMALREVRFEDGTVWTAEMLAAMALASTGHDDLRLGSAPGETTTGCSGACAPPPLSFARQTGAPSCATTASRPTAWPASPGRISWAGCATTTSPVMRAATGTTGPRPFPTATAGSCRRIVAWATWATSSSPTSRRRGRRSRGRSAAAATSG